MAPPSHTAAPPSYTPGFDRRNPEHWGKRILVAASTAAILGSILTSLGFRYITPGQSAAELVKDVRANTARIGHVERTLDSLARGQRTSTYISCELFKRQFPNTPKPEGCP